MYMTAQLLSLFTILLLHGLLCLKFHGSELNSFDRSYGEGRCHFGLQRCIYMTALVAPHLYVFM